MPDRVDARLAELGIVLPEPTFPHDPLDAVVVHGDLAFTSGQLPRLDGKLTCLGVLGAGVSVEGGPGRIRFLDQLRGLLIGVQAASLANLQQCVARLLEVIEHPGFFGKVAFAVRGELHVNLGEPRIQ